MTSPRDPALENTANVAALRLRSMLGLEPSTAVPVGVILGTGWGDALELKDATEEIPLAGLPGFEGLPRLEGHRRAVRIGTVGRTRVAALSGRIHMNEAHDPDHWKLVRLQTEMLIKLGAKTIVVTCAAGSLSKDVRVGDILLIDGFLMSVAPRLPLVRGEFCSPEDTLDRKLRTAANMLFIGDDPRSVHVGGYAMLLGPAFEGRKYDKPFLASTGIKAVGMSVLPEAAVAALYGGVKVLPMAFITNDAYEEHSHEENLRRSKERAPLLGDYLARVINAIPRT